MLGESLNGLDRDKSYLVIILDFTEIENVHLNMARLERYMWVSRSFWAVDTVTRCKFEFNVLDLFFHYAYLKYELILPSPTQSI